MDTKSLLVGVWFGATLFTLFFAIVFLVYISSVHLSKSITHKFQLYAALPSKQLQESDKIEYVDARAKIVENFFKQYNSVLAPYSELFISAADNYRLDFRLLPAISMQESNGGKKVIADSHNPFGYGIYGNKSLKFNSWEEAIERVARALREDYLNEGLKTPNQIMSKYTPPSLSKGGTWAKGVSSFMEELR